MGIWLIIIFIFAGILAILLGFYRLWFLRDPKRDILHGKVIVSPAMGKIHSIVHTDSKNIQIGKALLGKINSTIKDVSKNATIISITMTPIDVHYQRAPMDGKIISKKYSKGKFLNAVLDSRNMKATLENEKNEILIKTEIGNIKVIQIAGFVARRIVDFVQKDQYIKKGETIGLIKLGSQVSIILPKKKIRLIVKEGQKVVDGRTVLAKIR